MDDKYFVFDILEMEKNMFVNMAIALNEASCSNIYKELRKQADEISEWNKKMFAFAEEKGWYVLEDETKTKLESTIDKLRLSYENDL